MDTKFIFIVGKTCTGKDTLMKKILKTFQTNCIPLKNCTTRPKRTENENTYTFLSREEMLKALFDGSLIECQEYNGWYYGILESSIKENYANISVLSIERANLWYDYLKANKLLSNSLIIFIEEPEKTRLFRYVNRLINDNQFDIPSLKEMIRRFETEEKDYLTPLEDFPNVLNISSHDYYSDIANKINKFIIKGVL